jgi:hypothetical protein
MILQDNIKKKLNIFVLKSHCRSRLSFHVKDADRFALRDSAKAKLDNEIVNFR